MAITITNDGQTIKIDDGTIVRSIAKVGTGVFVNPLNNNEILIDRADGRTLTYNYNDVTTPSVINAEELREEIIAIINSSIDLTTSALAIIDYEHFETHGGNHYNFCTHNQDLDDTNTIEYIITTPDTAKWGHLVWEVSGALTTLVQFYEATTHTTDVVQSIYNHNRNSSNTPGLTIHTSKDDNVDGVRIDCASFGIDTGVGISMRSGGGSARGGQEWILKQNTKYLLKVTSGADNNNVNIRIMWYEHTNQN